MYVVIWVACNLIEDILAREIYVKVVRRVFIKRINNL